MNPIAYARASDAAGAISTTEANLRAHYIAGGTNLVDLMKDDVARPTTLVDITTLPMREIRTDTHGSVWLGALATMADVADDAAVQRDFPFVSQALLQSASAQLRNMATIGGNVLQRTRCSYFRDVSQPCNKRQPGSGCTAIGGENRFHAVIGTSAHCICSHPSDLAVALLAAGGRVHTRSSSVTRTIPIERFYVLPGERPDIETTLAPGELIEAIELPASAAARNSTYLKVRDRASYEFALVSVAAALELDGGTIRSARVALGGVAPVPWRAHAIEALLTGAPATNATFDRAGAAASVGMHGYGKNDYKLPLIRNAVTLALQTVGGMA
jgi:xanthine dehydrogenase YagS FAD-binding subunit